MKTHFPKRTWPFGTRRAVKVISAAILQRAGKLVPFLVVVETAGKTKEGHVLIDCGGEDAKKDDLATIIFTGGGPTGGFWKYEQSEPTTQQPTTQDHHD